MKDMATMRAELDRLKVQCQEHDAELTRLTRRNITVMPYRERKLRKFGGTESFEEWEADARAAITGSGLGDEEAAEFLFTKLEGNVRREIVCRGGHDNLTVDQLSAKCS